MGTGAILAHAGSWSSDQWSYLAVPLAVYGGCVLALLKGGQAEAASPARSFFRQISDSLERLTGFPGWSMAGALSGLTALLIGVIGLYWDVAWHIDYGRDQQLFTPAHVMILVGLGGLFYAGLVAATVATIDRAAVGFSLRGIRIPWSALTVAVMGAGAIAAFPLDNLWHQAYGLDVTLWSPTHLQLLGGGALATLAVWLMLAEARQGAQPTAVGRAIHVMAAGSALTGLTTFQGEFDFGVPQFQVVYLPVLIAVAAALTLVLARLALGPWGAVKAVGFYLALRIFLALIVTGALNHTLPRFPLYLPSALAVEGAALLAGHTRRLRFALTAGALVGTVGLLGELTWVTLSGYGPPSPALLPKIAVLGPLAAIGAAVLGAGLARAFSQGERRVPTASLALASLALLASLAYPLPRNVGNVHALISLDRTGDRAWVKVQLQPADAARHATAFAVSSWQGGGRETAMLREIAPGQYISAQPVPVTGRWKTMVALSRGDEVMAAPVYMPADPEIGAAEIPAAPERRASFVRNTDLLLRETHGGPPLPAALAYTGWGISVALWIALLAVTAIHAQPGSVGFAARSAGILGPKAAASP